MPDRSERISVIIPVYNVKPYLPQCLDSVLRQTYRELEILLIDDGSTDGSGEICDDYARRDARIRVFHTENRGLAAARNFGLDRASGAFLSFVDSDDWIEDNAMEVLLEAQRRYRADITAAEVCREWLNSTRRKKTEKDIRVLCGEEILPAYMKGMLWDVVWNKLYSRELFTRLRFPTITYKLIKQLAESGGTIVRLPDVLFHFRVRKSSISHTKSLKNLTDCWEAYYEKYREMGEYGKPVLIPCMTAIYRMWSSYPGFSHAEKAQAADLVKAMKTFSRAHFREVMTGRYPKKTKVSALLSQFTTGMYFAGLIEEYRKSKLQKKMFQ